MRRSFVKAILTDSHFWIPLSVLVLGVLLLIYVH
ncbi:MAG: translocated intimin receptor Tir [Terriglobia bacterium]